MEQHLEGNHFAFHKDDNPTCTVTRIRDILVSLGFDGIRECTTYNPLPHCHSLMITDPGFPVYTANGKGVSRELALASAYGEFMERLQCIHATRSTRLGRMNVSDSFFHDAQQVAVTDLCRDVPEVMSDLVTEPFTMPVNRLECLPFYNVFEKREQLLPYRLMTLNFTSTGMSAGNTSEESLTQGICEVLERHPIRLLVQGCAEAMPNIPVENLPISTAGMRQMLSDISRAGIELIIKDCTLGGSIPVLAAILIDRKGDRFALDYGCDPVFDVALERCITEAFQGRHSLPHRFSHWCDSTELPLEIFNNVHGTLPFLMRDAPAVEFRSAFTIPGLSNAAYLRFLVGRIMDLGLALYARDFSFLGFPSHQVFIQRMSAPRPLSTDDCQFYYAEAEELFSLLTILAENAAPSKAILQRMADILSRRMKQQSIYAKSFEELLSKRLLHAPLDELWFSSRLLMAFIFIETDHLEDAQRVLQAPPLPETDEKTSALCNLLSHYCTLLRAGEGDANIAARLNEDHGQGPFGEHIHRLLSREYASLYFMDQIDSPGRRFKGLPLPSCSSLFACEVCTCRRSCYVNRFLILRGRLRKAYRPISQRGFGAWLQHLLEDAKE